MTAQLSSGARVGVLAGLKEASGFALQASYELPTNDECERAEALSVRINAARAAVAELVAAVAAVYGEPCYDEDNAGDDPCTPDCMSCRIRAALAAFSEPQS